jgi:hypothetical protein
MTVEGVPFSGSSFFQPIHHQVKVFGHDDVSEDHETVTYTHLLENLQQQIATARRIQQRQAAIATAGDEVGVLSAVVTMQTAGHENALVSRGPLR